MANILIHKKHVSDLIKTATEYPPDSTTLRTIDRLLSGAATEDVSLSFLLFQIGDLETLLQNFHIRRVRKIVSGLFDILLNQTPDDLYVDCLGPNEIILLLPGVGKEKARDAGEEIRRRFLTMAREILNDPSTAIDLRGSVVAFPEDGKCVAELLCQARDALSLSRENPEQSIQIGKPASCQPYSIELPEILIRRMRRFTQSLDVMESTFIRQALDEFLHKAESV